MDAAAFTKKTEMAVAAAMITAREIGENRVRFCMTQSRWNGKRGGVCRLSRACGIGSYCIWLELSIWSVDLRERGGDVDSEKHLVLGFEVIRIGQSRCGRGSYVRNQSADECARLHYMRRHREGWLYLVGHKDLCTRQIVGYAMGERMTRNVVIESLRRAVEATRPSAGLVHHSDRGSQYCSAEYRKMLEALGMTASMSGTGNCYDNAPMESFWATLKTELVFHRRFATRQQAIQEITEYIEVFYNRQRIQKQLGYLSPAAFERRYYEQRLAA